MGGRVGIAGNITFPKIKLLAARGESLESHVTLEY